MSKSFRVPLGIAGLALVHEVSQVVFAGGM